MILLSKPECPSMLKSPEVYPETVSSIFLAKYLQHWLQIPEYSVCPTFCIGMFAGTALTLIFQASCIEKFLSEIMKCKCKVLFIKVLQLIMFIFGIYFINHSVIFRRFLAKSGSLFKKSNNSVMISKLSSRKMIDRHSMLCKTILIPNYRPLDGPLQPQKLRWVTGGIYLNHEKQAQNVRHRCVFEKFNMFCLHFFWKIKSTFISFLKGRVHLKKKVEKFLNLGPNPTPPPKVYDLKNIFCSRNKPIRFISRI